MLLFAGSGQVSQQVEKVEIEDDDVQPKALHFLKPKYSLTSPVGERAVWHIEPIHQGEVE